MDSHIDIRQRAPRTMPTLPAVGLDDGDWSKTWEVPLSVEYWRMQMSQGDAVGSRQMDAADISNHRHHPGLHPGRGGGPLSRINADMQLLCPGSTMDFLHDLGSLPADLQWQTRRAHPPYLQDFSFEPAPHSHQLQHQQQHQRQPWQSVGKKTDFAQNLPLRTLDANLMMDGANMQPQTIKQGPPVWNRPHATTGLGTSKADAHEKSFSTASGRESLEDEAGLRLLIKMAATRRPGTGKKQAAPAPPMRGGSKSGRKHPLAPLPVSWRQERKLTTGARASSRAAQHGVEEVGGGLMLRPPARDLASLLDVDAASDGTNTASQTVARADMPRESSHRPVAEHGLRDAGGGGRRFGEPLDAISCLRLGSVRGLSEGDGGFAGQGGARHIHGVEGEENPGNPLPVQAPLRGEALVVPAPSPGAICRDGAHGAGPRRQEESPPNRSQPVESSVLTSLSAMGGMVSSGAGVGGGDEDGAMHVGVAALLSSLTSAIARASPADLESLVHASMERRRLPAALVLQRSTRMHLSRKRAGALRSARSSQVAATLIQACSRGHAARRTIQQARARLAAQTIASAWRVHAARRIARWAWLDREADRARARVRVYAAMTLQGVARRKLALLDFEQCQAETRVRADGRSSMLQVQEEIAEKMASISILQEGTAVQDVAGGEHPAGPGRVLGIKPLPPSRRGSKRRRGKSHVSRTAMGPLMRAMLEAKEEERVGRKIGGFGGEDECGGAGVDERGLEVQNGNDDIANAESDRREVDGGVGVGVGVEEKGCVAAEVTQMCALSTCRSEERPATECSPTVTPKKGGSASPDQGQLSPQTPLGASPSTPVRYILAAADSAGKSRGRALSIEEQLEECAVTCLQSVWRGHAVRKSLQQHQPPAREPSAGVDLPSSGGATVLTGRSFQRIDASTGRARACHPDVGDGTWAHSLKNFGDASSPRPVLSSSPAKGRKATEVSVYADVIVRGGNVSPPHAGSGERVGQI